MKPFGLTVVVNSKGDAHGDLFYDDGESIDPVGKKSYYHATFHWSSSYQRLSIDVLENNYPAMANLTLDTITFYGLQHIPTIITVNEKQFIAKVRPFTQIVDIIGLRLPMNRSHSFTWSNTTVMPIELPEATMFNPRYRVDCFPDPGMSLEPVEFLFTTRVF